MKLSDIDRITKLHEQFNELERVCHELSARYTYSFKIVQEGKELFKFNDALAKATVAELRRQQEVLMSSLMLLGVDDFEGKGGR